MVLISTFTKKKVFFFFLEERFDAVLIDACDADIVLPCPAAEFLDEHLIATLSKKLLLPNGE